MGLATSPQTVPCKRIRWSMPFGKLMMRRKKKRTLNQVLRDCSSCCSFEIIWGKMLSWCQAMMWQKCPSASRCIAVLGLLVQQCSGAFWYAVPWGLILHTSVAVTSPGEGRKNTQQSRRGGRSIGSDSGRIQQLFYEVWVVKRAGMEERQTNRGRCRGGSPLPWKNGSLILEGPSWIQVGPPLTICRICLTTRFPVLPLWSRAVTTT